VSSLHHQGVATLGADWRVSAWAADGLVEGAEWGDRTVGVQWHPELDGSGPALFGWLLETAGQATV
jgi:putative glutamine amidotransferase